MTPRKRPTRSVSEAAAQAPLSFPEHAPAAAPPAQPHWRQLLAASSAREVLARLFQGDPLRLRALAGDVLRERAYALDIGRVYLRSLAYVARFAVRYRGQPDLEVWLRERVDEAALDVVLEDRERAACAAAEPPAAFRDLARPLGLDAAVVWRAAVAFNECEQEQRAAYYAWILDGQTLESVARDEGVSPTTIGRRARAALDALLRAESAARKFEETSR